MPKLYFYYSAMNAGKTTTLLQSSFNYKERGMTTLLFVPNMVGTIIKSRIGLEEIAIPINKEFNFELYMNTHFTDCIMVDEAQFLTKEQVLQLGRVVDNCNIPVLCYGIRTDFRGEPFTGSKYLLSIADNIVEIKTICTCGKKAIMNTRIGADGLRNDTGEQILIGGEHYISVCRKCYNNK